MIEIIHVIMIEINKIARYWMVQLVYFAGLRHVKISNILKTLLKVKYYPGKTHRFIIVDTCLIE